MNSSDFTQLSQFVHYTDQRFDLPWLAGAFTDSRPQPEIPSRAVWLILILGEVVQIGSHLQLEEETQLPQWQRWVGYPKPISHDTFGYVSERLDPAQLRRAAVWISRKLKRGKAFEASKLKGLLVVSLDANEQFCSDHRCCEDCLSREVTCKHADGQDYKKTQYYHKQVYAQVSGPGLSVILDFEPMRPPSHVGGSVQFGNPWHLLDEVMGRYELLDQPDLPFPLGGCLGFWGYDLKNFAEPKLPRHAVNDVELPDCHIGFYDSLVVFDHRLSKTWVLATGFNPDGTRDAARAAPPACP